MNDRRVQVTVPLALEFAAARREGSVHVCLDRRVACAVGAAPGRIVIESRDSGQTLEVHGASANVTGEAAVVLAVMRQLGIGDGHFILQRRVPLASGLPVLPSVALAVAAASLAHVGRDLTEASALARAGAREAGFEDDASAFVAPILGGVVLVEPSASEGRRLPVDPARVEECLLLVDTTVAADAGPSEPRPVASLQRIVEALEAGRMDEVALLLGQAEAEPPGDPSAKIAALARQSGGAMVRQRSRGGYAVVFAAPGERAAGPKEVLETRLREAGLRVVRPRVDLLGLEKG